MTLAYSYITKLPVVKVTHIDELEFAVDYFAQRYAEITLKKFDAWLLYNEAIDKELGTETIRLLGELAATFELESVATWQEWQDAKRDLLAINN